MFKITSALALTLLAVACDATDPPRAQQLISAAPMATRSSSANAYCAAGNTCSVDLDCGMGMLCASGACVAPCEVDGQCLSVPELVSVCSKEGVCVVKTSGDPWCPAPCTAGDSCTSDGDCGPMAPHCMMPPGEEKGECVVPCQQQPECAGQCLLPAGYCADATGAASCS
jgi:hypothetical protein